MSELRSLPSRLLAEPLVGFAVLGALLFAIDRARTPADESRRIVLDAPFVEGLRTEATRRTGHAPDEAETHALVDAWVREEALYREARALSLDVGDVIVRRRLVQKIELLMAAEAAPAEPSDEELHAYLDAHASAYARPDRSSFTLCFTARELHDDARATAEARLADDTHAPCDPLLAGDTFHAQTDAQLGAIVGAEATSTLHDAAMGSWRGVFETPRGFYLVRIDERTPGGRRTLDEVHDAVRDALVEARRTQILMQRRAEIVAQYQVVHL